MAFKHGEGGAALVISTGRGRRGSDPPRDLDWLRALRCYLAVSALGNVVWELVQLPLSTIWSQGTARDKLAAVLHCTAGDILIAVSAWAFAVLIGGHLDWPAQAFRRVALLTIAFGLAYAGFSEWLNATVRHSWTYSDLMPVIPGFGLGLSPLLQWLVIPSLALWAARRRRMPGETGNRSQVMRHGSL